MRSAVYALAVVAAAGIAYLFVTVPAPSDAAVGSATPTSATAHEVMAEGGMITLRVDDMHCPFACYPAVKSAIESQSNVVAVELDKQQAEGAIDNPQVLIKYDSGFDLTAALDALGKKGFDKHSVVQ